MPDESNFCLNCGENLAKYHASSGFVREPAGETTGGTAKGAAGAPAVEVDVTGASTSVTRATTVPTQVRAHLSKARLAADGGKLQDAAEHFQDAIELDPVSADAWYGLGVIYGRLGRQLEALAAFNRLVEVSPRLAAAWDAKGTALAAL